MRSELAWSLIDPKPVFLYDPKYDAHITIWNGVAMTRTYALMIYSVFWCNIYPSPSQKKAAWDEYIRIYRSGGFKTRDWDNIINDIQPEQLHNRLSAMMVIKDPMFLMRLKNKYSAKDALSWFLPSKEIVDKNIKI